MTAYVVVSCDREMTYGTCPARSLGRFGEDVEQTVQRALAAGWRRVGERQLHCPSCAGTGRLASVAL